MTPVPLQAGPFIFWAIVIIVGLAIFLFVRSRRSEADFPAAQSRPPLLPPQHSVATQSTTAPPLGAPQLPADYFEDILRIKGYRVTRHNLGVLERKVREMFLIKARQFITLGGKQNQHGADQFSRQWGSSSAQQILNALAATDPELPKYIDDLPDRVRRIILDSDGEGTFWDEMED